MTSRQVFEERKLAFLPKHNNIKTNQFPVSAATTYTIKLAAIKNFTHAEKRQIWRK